MLDFLEQIPLEWRPLALMIFVVGGAVAAVLNYMRGKKSGPEAPRVQEFYAAGQLADMGPVKELVECVGLLVQQQIKTNLQLERTATALATAADAYVKHLEEEATQEEVERRARELHEQWRKDEPRRTRKPAE